MLRTAASNDEVPKSLPPPPPPNDPTNQQAGTSSNSQFSRLTSVGRTRL